MQFDSDVLFLKFASRFHGLDKAVVDRLIASGIKVSTPNLGCSTLINTNDVIAPNYVLLQGVQPLHHFGYTEIRDFVRTAMQTAAEQIPMIHRITLTIHGPGYGLDEIEAFESALAGIVDAINTRKIPPKIEEIIFVDKDGGRARRLSSALSMLLPQGTLIIGDSGDIAPLGSEAQATLRTAGYSSLSKAHVFVAMPFQSDMDDVFHYGIQGAVKSQGMLCERADLAIFTGDVVDWVKKRISDAKLVIADLSTANANVYLEVGYAWGCKIPTILLARNSSDLKFDVKGQKCLIYNSIKHLEENLRNELIYLLRDGS